MNWQQRDKQVIWHPYTQHQSSQLPITIVRGEGTCLFDEYGNKYIDAISSWWVNIHGHSHPYIAQKVYEQFCTLEHSIFAGFTHPPAITLAERLLAILPNNQQKVFYSDNGSTAVEVALKMAIQYWVNRGEKRPKILALKNAYHGDTFGAMAVSGRSAFTQAFDELLFDVEFIDLPTAENLESLKSKVYSLRSQLAAFIFEPLVQGAAGMVMYEAALLDELLQHCKQCNIITIADEVMTGFGRTGKLFAMHHVHQQPDIMCLSKGITGGVMALGVTTCSEPIFEAFLSSDYTKTLFHGHSFTANPLACAAALASLDLLLADTCTTQIAGISTRHTAYKAKLESNKAVAQVRTLGTILAIELKSDETTNYFNSMRDKCAAFFIPKGILLRPLGNIIYVIPPYCITEQELDAVYTAIDEFITFVID